MDVGRVDGFVPRLHKELGLSSFLPAPAQVLLLVLDQLEQVPPAPSLLSVL